MLEERFDDIDRKLDQVLEMHRALPTWYPITKLFAEERGYETTDGLRKHCQNNLVSEDFIKHGKIWYIHRRALPLVNRKSG